MFHIGMSDIYFSWSRDGHKLLSAATDNTVSVWDVIEGECDKSYRFPSPILKVQFHPRVR
jgi:COMPASS component SWD1